MTQADIKVVRKDELEHKRWSGGITTQLAIWPEGADYGARKFDWRISSAVVEDEESVFTPLPGIHRHLMLLEGGIELTHEGIGSRVMIPLADTEEFEGEWKTKSSGRCVDFNLMTVKGYGGKMESVAANKKIKLPMPQELRCWYGLYAIADGVAAEVEKDGRFARVTLERGDFILITYLPAPGEEISLTLGSDAAVPAVSAAVWQES
jgi:uncharacterized protein